MKNTLIYLNSYILQQDMRIRLPKNILQNLNIKKGITIFAVYLNKEDNSIVLKAQSKKEIN